MNRKFDSKRLDYLWALSEQMKFFDKASYYDLLSRAFEDYINGTIWMTGQIRLHMNDRCLEKICFIVENTEIQLKIMTMA